MKTLNLLKNAVCKTKHLALLVLLMFMYTSVRADVLIIDGDHASLTSTATTTANDYSYTADNSESYTIKMYKVKYQPLGSGGDAATNNLSTGKTIMIGKSGAYMYNTTAFGNKITGFKVYSNSIASTSVQISVCFSSSSITSLCGSPAYSATLSTKDHVYDLTSNLSDGDKYFYLQVVSDHNAQLQIEVTFETCDKEVTPAAGTKTNVSTITFNKSKVATCSATAANRQVTATITPASCYAVPSSTRLTVTGTSASYVSGPTDNGDGTYSFVYQYAQNATGTSTFAASLDTKTTYTVSYNAGSTTHTGGNAISGSHANDTKTCDTNLTLPGVTFTTTGYTQTGWTKTDGGSKTNNLSGSYTSNQAQTFYPAWTVNNYTVTWKVDGEVYTPSDSGGTDGSSSVNYGSKVSTLPTPPDPNDHCGSRFMGWTTTEIYTDDDPPAVLFTTAGSAPTAEGNQTFYAVFADYAE